jgi:hypothetical protein
MALKTLNMDAYLIKAVNSHPMVMQLLAHKDSAQAHDDDDIINDAEHKSIGADLWEC